MFKFRHIRDNGSRELLASELFDQNTFYLSFMNDLKRAKQQAIIESPFITARRMKSLIPIFRRLTKLGVRIVINTKPLDEQESLYYVQARAAIAELQSIGAIVLFTGGHHRKIAIIDRNILWEGSLNILSQNDSCEIMRRIESTQMVQQTIEFMQINKYLQG